MDCPGGGARAVPLGELPPFLPLPTLRPSGSKLMNIKVVIRTVRIHANVIIPIKKKKKRRIKNKEVSQERTQIVTHVPTQTNREPSPDRNSSP
jgi:hypothetical protein